VERSGALLIQKKRDVDVHESLTSAEARSDRHLHPAAWQVDLAWSGADPVAG
jgi:hypothetical protein